MCVCVFQMVQCMSDNISTKYVGRTYVPAFCGLGRSAKQNISKHAGILIRDFFVYAGRYAKATLTYDDSVRLVTFPRLWRCTELILKPFSGQCWLATQFSGEIGAIFSL